MSLSQEKLDEYSKNLSGRLSRVTAKKPGHFAFCPDRKEPVLMIDKRVVNSSFLKKYYGTFDGTLASNKVWVGRVKRRGNKLRFSINEKLSKGKVKTNAFAHGLKVLSRDLKIPLLKNALIVARQAEGRLVDETDRDKAASDGYGNVHASLKQLHAASLNHKKRTEIMATVRQDARRWLADEGNTDPAERATMWKMLRGAMLATGEAPSGNEIGIAEKMMVASLEQLLAALGGSDDTRKAAAWERLVSMQTDLDLWADEASDALNGLQKRVKLAITEHQSFGDTLEEAEDEDDDKWGKEYSGGLLEVPEDVEVLTLPDPGVKAKLSGNNVALYQSFEVKDDEIKWGAPVVAKEGVVQSGARCVVTRTRHDAVVHVELYRLGDAEKHEESLVITASGYTGIGGVKTHKKGHRMKDLKPGDKLFEHAPVMDDVKQGAVGDCYLMAAIASVVDIDPDAIAKMVRDNGDGTVTIKMYEVSEENGEKTFTERYVQVKKSVNFRTIGGSQHARNAHWVQMVEKAYAAHFIKGSKSYKQLAMGGYTNDAVEALLGRPANEKHSLPVPKLPWGRDAPERYCVSSNDLESWGDEALAETMTYFLKDKKAEDANYQPPEIPDNACRDEVEEILKANGLTGTMTIAYNKIRVDLRDKLLKTQKKYDQDKERSTEDENNTIKARIDALQQKLASLEGVADREVNLDEIRTQIMGMVQDRFPGPVGSGIYTAQQVQQFKDLKAGCAAKKSITAGTRKELPGSKTLLDKLMKGFSGGEFTTTGMVATHAYNVTAVEGELSEDESVLVGKAWVSVRNPWGGFGRRYVEVDGKLVAKKTGNAISKLELTDFLRTFHKFVIC